MAIQASSFGNDLPGARIIESNSPGLPALLLRVLRVSATVAYYIVPAAFGSVGLGLCGRQDEARRHLFRYVAMTVQQLGPAFIKMGQLLGMRRDVLPPELCDALSVLRDAVPPLSEAVARATLATVYGARLEELFPTIDFRAVASGSIASVYRGTLADGRDVAIKIRRPNIQRVMAADMKLVAILGAVASRLPLFRGAPVDEMLQYLCDAVYAQLDFEQEAASLARLRQDLSALPQVLIPRVVAQFSNDEVLVMDFICGLDSTIPARSPTGLTKKFAASTLDAIYQMIFVEGFVHCDLHPGNLYFTDRGQSVVLDAGFTVQLSERIRRLFAEFFLNMSVGRGLRCAEIVVQSATAVDPSVDVSAFSTEVAGLVKRSSGLPAKDFSLMSFATELFDLQRRFGLHASAELVFPLLSLLVVETTVRTLDPHVDFQKQAAPILTRGLFGTRRDTW